MTDIGRPTSFKTMMARPTPQSLGQYAPPPPPLLPLPFPPSPRPSSPRLPLPPVHEPGSFMIHSYHSRGIGRLKNASSYVYAWYRLALTGCVRYIDAAHVALLVDRGHRDPFRPLSGASPRTTDESRLPRSLVLQLRARPRTCHRRCAECL